MPACIVKGCSFSWRQKDPEITLHVFPRDPHMIRKWLLQIYRKEEGLGEFVEKIKNSKKGVYRICSRHFTADCYEIKNIGKVFRKDSIPTIFPWAVPYPLEEQRADHPYAKKRKLQSKARKCADKQSEEASEPSTAPAPASVPTPQQFVMSQFANKIFNRSFPEFPAAPSSFSTPLKAEDATSNCQSAEENRPKRHFRPRSRRTIGTVTNKFVVTSHKSDEIDAQASGNAAQDSPRPSRRSVALQCNLVKLPALTQAGKPQATETVIVKLDDLRANPATASLADFVEQSMTVQISEEGERSGSPRSSVNSTTDMHGEVKMEPEDVSDESPSPRVETAAEEEEMNEKRPTDPIDADISPIFLPEDKSPVDHVKERKFIVFESCLNKLLMCCKCLAAANCRGNIAKLKKYRIGSAVIVTAVCSMKHEFHLWTSQPMIGRTPVGNLLLSSSTLCSGSNFFKVESFLRLAGILGISHATHNSNQNRYLFPAIDHHWKLERKSIVENLQRRPVALVADGQCKLYASRAKCCAYNFLEYHSKKIIDFQVESLNPFESAASLERKTFRAALDRLMKDKLNVRVVCTDRHAGIKRLLRKHYGRIKHQYDVWHFARSVGARISVASRKHDCHKLEKWIGPAKNHLWWSARTCAADLTLLKEKWISIAHHAADRHRWEEATLYDACQHSDDQQNKDWLEVGSEAHLQLKDIVLDKGLLEDLRQLATFCHADELDVFNSIAQKYHARNTRYSVDGMVARSQLAALDYNRNIGQIQGLVKMATTYGDKHGWYINSKSKRDLVQARISNPANQDFMKDIMADVLSFADGKKTFGSAPQQPERVRNPTPLIRPARLKILKEHVYRVPQMV